MLLLNIYHLLNSVTAPHSHPQRIGLSSTSHVHSFFLNVPILLPVLLLYLLLSCFLTLSLVLLEQHFIVKAHTGIVLFCLRLFSLLKIKPHIHNYSHAMVYGLPGSFSGYLNSGFRFMFTSVLSYFVSGLRIFSNFLNINFFSYVRGLLYSLFIPLCACLHVPEPGVYKFLKNFL